MARLISKWLSNNGNVFDTEAEALRDDKREDLVSEICDRCGLIQSHARFIVDNWDVLKEIVEKDQ